MTPADDKPSTPAEMVSVLREAGDLLDGVLDSIIEARHASSEAISEDMADAQERVRQAWASVTIARTALSNIATRATLHRIVGLTE